MSSMSSRLAWGLCLTTIDISICVICAFLHGTNFSVANFTEQLTNFSFLTSTLDLLVLAVIRCILWILPAILHYSGASPKKFKFYQQVISCVALVMFLSSPTKILLLTEPKAPGELLFFGDYLFLIWNIIAAILLDYSWKLYFSKAPSSYVVLDEEDEDEEQTTPKETLQMLYRLMQYCKKEWIWQISGFTWMFLLSITRIFVPYYTGQVIASLVATKSYSSLVSSVSLMAGISLVSALSAGLCRGSFDYAYSKVNKAIRYDLFSAIVQQDVAFFDAHKTGEIASRLASDCQTVSDTISTSILIFLRNFSVLSGSVIFMMTLSWRLSLITFIVVPVIFVLSQIFGEYYDIIAEKTQDTIAHSNDVAEEVLSTMRTVRSFACEHVEEDRYYGKLTDTLKMATKESYIYIAFYWASEFFQSVIAIAVLWYGGHLVLQKKMQGDLLVSFLLYQMQLGENVREMEEVWSCLMHSIGGSRKVFEYIDRKPTIQHNGTSQPSQLKGRIEFRNVHFSYPTRSNNPILKDLSFTVEPGETVALVGPSGSGKSSCIALLENFYQPVAGQILIDGIPLDEYEHHYIHRKIALVGQEPVLFARSVMENIRYGCDDKTETDCINAAVMANAHDFVMDTTDKYETNVGEKGSQMSGGQKQRIAIARALVRQPVVLLLDEATSALDTESEAVVQEAIYKNLEGKSVILIAHRLSTVEKADKIIVINEGRVEEMGTHKELLNQSGMYATLVKRQMLGGRKKKRKVTPPLFYRSISEGAGCHGGALSLLSARFSLN